MNSIKTGSDQWYSIKRRNFGGNDCASLLGHGFQEPSQVIKHKILGIEDDLSHVARVQKGLRYEDVVRQRFAQRHGISIRETGLRFHRKYKWLTASPDGYSPELKALTEFKVREDISVGGIPYKYWIQMQIQMEVWDVNTCYYCENKVREYQSLDEYLADYKAGESDILDVSGTKYYWRLLEFREEIIARDSNWFKSVLPTLERSWKLVIAGRSTKKRKNNSDDSDESEEIQKRLKYLDEHQDMLYPYMLTNFIHNDPLLDWLNIYGPEDKKDHDGPSILGFMSRKNREFALHVRQYIKTHLTDIDYVDLDECELPDEIIDNTEKPSFSYEKAEATQSAMDNNVPIIFGAYIKAETDYGQLGGRVDMLIRSDTGILNIHSLNKDFNDGEEDSSIDGEENGESSSTETTGWYRVVSFRYATINLTSDGTHLLNNSKQKNYKIQAWFLNYILGQKSAKSYVIGRRYKSTHEVSNSSFDTIGTIDFADIDKDYNVKGIDALKWLRSIPEQIDETTLMPNMKNHSDFPWHSYKCEMATRIYDITKMYMCGPKIRQHAIQCGVTDWRNLTPTSLKFRKGSLRNRIMMFVKANTVGYRKTQIQLPATKSYFIDFEAITNIHDSFTTFPAAEDHSMIFLIGVVANDVFKSYLAQDMSPDEERRIITNMLDYIDSDGLVYYWGNAEKTLLTRAKGKYPDLSDRIDALKLVDLCTIFRSEGFVLENLMNYGLKHVSKVLYDVGHITTIWPDTSYIKDGLCAMIEALKCYNKSVDVDEEDIFTNIIEYNYIDCKVMQDIVSYLQQ